MAIASKESKNLPARPDKGSIGLIKATIHCTFADRSVCVARKSTCGNPPLRHRSFANA